MTDIPYYRDLVAAGRAPREIDSWDAFRKIPILDRETLQHHSAKFQRLSGAPDYCSSTAGSTGQPVQFGVWRNEAAPLRIAKLVPWIRMGYTLDNEVVLIWGHAHLLGTGWRRYYQHAVRKVKDSMAGYHRFDAYSLDPRKAACIAREIVRIRPAGLIGYAAVLDLLCRYSVEYHDELRQSGLNFVMPCAEPPPRPDSFDLLRSVFGCSIVQEFGGVDFGHVGFKIDDAPYTLFPELNVLEAESAESDKNAGAAVLTSLYRRYMPLIRYRQGDVISGVERDQQGFVVTFEEQVGRVNDMITLSDGRSIHSVALVHCFKEEPEILNVQLILTDDGPSFSLVVQEKLTNKKELAVRARLRQIHPQFAPAPFIYVTDLMTNAAGKRRWVRDQRTAHFSP